MQKFSWPLLVRYFFKVSFYPFMMLDLFSIRLVEKVFRRRYQRQGKCLRCGKCCRNILIFQPKNWWGRLYLKWNMEVNGFYPRNYPILDVNGEKMILMTCRYLKSDNTCANYFWRPLICRNWPQIDDRHGLRALLGCGYVLKDRKKD